MKKFNTYLAFMLIIPILCLLFGCIENKEEEVIFRFEEKEEIVEIKTQFDTLAKAKSALNIRKEPNIQSKILGVMDKGDLLKITGEKDDFYEVRYLNDFAYLSKEYVDLINFEKSEDKIESVIAVGYTLMGFPYVYGAQRYRYNMNIDNPNFEYGKFDCSSLVQYAYLVGANEFLGVTTRDQVFNGYEVSDQIKRGDLLFFTNSSRVNKSGVERIGHVAIYLRDNYILHTASDRAVIEKISDKRWSYYITARRVIL